MGRLSASGRYRGQLSEEVLPAALVVGGLGFGQAAVGDGDGCAAVGGVQAEFDHACAGR